MFFDFPIQRSAFLFSLRAMIAAWIALLLAFALGLDSPQWAAVTVCIVAQPSRGMTLSKSFYRLIGTAIGALVAVILIVDLSTTPWAFVLVLAAWTGLTTLAANLVRYFRSYAAVLAGYTAAIVGLLVYRQPDHVFELAKARILCVLLGIAVASLVTAIATKSEAKAELVVKIRTGLAKALEWPALIFFGSSSPSEIASQERRILVNLREIDELRSYAVAESLQIRMQSRQIYGLMASLFSILSSTRSVQLKLEHESEWRSPIRSSLRELGEVLQVLAGEIRNQETLSMARFESWKRSFTEARSQQLDFEKSAWHQGLVDRLHEFTEGIQSALSDYLALESKSKMGVRPDGLRGVTYHRDTKMGQIVGIRSFIAVLLAGGIWVFTGWENGPLMLMMTAINCGIFATSNHPIASLISALKASMCAVAAAFLCHKLFLADGMPTFSLLLSLGIFLIPGGIFAAESKTSTAGVLYSAFFLLFVGSLKPISFDLLAFYNTALGFFSGWAVTYAVFKLVLPTDPKIKMTTLSVEIVKELERAANARHGFVANEWETRMYSRVSQLMQIAVEAADEKTVLIDGGLAALDVGRELLRLRNLLQTPTQEQSPFQGQDKSLSVEGRSTIQMALSALSVISSDKKKAEVFFQSSFASRLQTEQNMVDRRAAVSLQEVADVMARNRAFFFRT